MEKSMNVWGIEEFQGDGLSCPIITANLPIYKKIVLFFFRFGVCPMCVTMSLGFNVIKYYKKFAHRISTGE